MSDVDYPREVFASRGWAEWVAAVRRAAGDPSVRMAAADWLDDLARPSVCRVCAGKKGFYAGVGPSELVPCSTCGATGEVEELSDRADFIRLGCRKWSGGLSETEMDAVKERERELHRRYGWSWFESTHSYLDDVPRHYTNVLKVSRGFACEAFASVEGLYRPLSIARWRKHPLTRFTLTDKEPSRWLAGADGQAREWVWERSMSDQPNPEDFTYLGAGPFAERHADPGAAVLPGWLFDRLTGGEARVAYPRIRKDAYRTYRTERDAVDDASAAALDFLFPEDSCTS